MVEGVQSQPVSPIPETESIQIDDDEEKIDGVSPVSHEENDT